MNSLNKINLSLNNNNLNLDAIVSKPLKVNVATTWCNIVPVISSSDLTDKYQDICQNYRDENKWILMINPENDSLEQLSNMGKINPEKILKVNSNKVNVSLENIKNTLLKGTCSALILSDGKYNQAELKEIAQCATIGKTHCILLQSSSLKAPSQLH